MWSDSDLRMARREMAKTFRTDCVIEREGKTGIQDALGGTEFTENEIRAKCRVDVMRTPKEITRGGQIVGTANNQILFPFGTEISITDRITVAGTVYSVLGVNDASDRFCETVYVTRD